MLACFFECRSLGVDSRHFLDVGRPPIAGLLKNGWKHKIALTRHSRWGKELRLTLHFAKPLANFSSRSKPFSIFLRLVA